MAQETVGQEVIRVDSSKPKKATRPTNGMVSVEVIIPRQTSQQVNNNTNIDPQDDSLWNCAVANSIDVIRELADKALADRRAGRTKKITL